MISPRRSRKHLDFVRSRQCAFCLLQADEAHHHSRKAGGGGSSIKGCDLLTVPLCHAHHNEWHSRAQVGDLSTAETQREMWKEIALTLRARLLEVEL